MSIVITTDMSDVRQNISLGLILPLNSSNTGIFSMSYTTKDQMKSNFKNLILTRRGERIMQPEFGTNIISSLFENITSNLNDVIAQDIKDSTSRFCPYINISKLDIKSNTDRNLIVIEIYYNLINSTYLEFLSLSVNQYGEIQIL